MPVRAGVTDEFLRLAMVNQKSQCDDKQNILFTKIELIYK